MKFKLKMWLLIISITSMVFSINILLRAEIVPTIEVMPRYAAAKCEEQSPFAVFLQVTGLEPGATDYTFTMRIAGNYGSFTTTSYGSFNTNYKELGIPHVDGTVRLWVYLRSSKSNPEPGVYNLRLRIKKDDDEISGSPWDLPGPELLDMSNTGKGAWVHANTIFAEPGKVVLAFDSDDQIIGTYVIEDNGLSEGYPSTQGYFKIAVPANTPIPKLELRDADNTSFDTKTNDSWWSGVAGSETNLDDQQPPNELIVTTIPEI